MTQQNVSTVSKRPFLSALILGLVLVFGGFIVLGDVVLATVISAVIIGICIIVSGVFEILYSIWAEGWRGFIWHTLLYIVFGYLLVSQPAVGALILTRIIG
ncbi:DUF308 domain-containing protein [Mesorhizobium sp. AR07]|uniref:DUF308 domain-containing protein n=1 Tax=Mesorhizobium sp. AR07 TaxID=2865838 RepID=UPI00215F7FE1|nr:DUF308 domain-containing protein [Mesorhizobium sp. AR07]